MLLVFGFGVSGVSGVVAYFLPAIGAALNITGHPSTGTSIHAQATPSATAAPAPNQPFNVLLLGSDNDTKFQPNHVLTQTMILVRVNPQAHTVAMLSIPRDLWVQLSTGGTAKIDAAYSYGGAAAAVKTVENNFGVPITYWVWIGLGGLVDLVNQLPGGGVNIVAQMPIMDDEYPYDLTGTNPYLQTRIAILPGPQRLGGVDALEYVRSRHGDILSDIARSQKQQQLLLDIKSAAKTLGLADVPSIASSLGNSLKTDMQLTQVASLLPLAKAFSSGNITQVIMLSQDYSSVTESDGEQALAPNWTAINALVAQYFPA